MCVMSFLANEWLRTCLPSVETKAPVPEFGSRGLERGAVYVNFYVLLACLFRKHDAWDSFFLFTVR